MFICFPVHSPLITYSIAGAGTCPGPSSPLPLDTPSTAQDIPGHHISFNGIN